MDRKIKDAQKSCGRKSSCDGVWQNNGAAIIANNQRNRNCQDVDVKPIVRDPIDDDRILVEPGAEMTLVPREPSELGKLKQLTHIPFQPWRTSCVKGKAQAEPHKRTGRITEDSELAAIQCDYLMLKDVAATSGLKVLSMYVSTLGYGGWKGIWKSRTEVGRQMEIWRVVGQGRAPCPNRRRS